MKALRARHLNADDNEPASVHGMIDTAARTVTFTPAELAKALAIGMFCSILIALVLAVGG